MKKWSSLLKNWECKILALAFFAIIFFYGWRERLVLKDFFGALFSGDSAAVTEALGTLETSYQENVYNKNQLVNLDGALYRAAGRTRMNNVVKLNNGYLTNVRSTSLFDAKNAEFLIHAGQQVQAQDIPFLFVMAPYKICAEDKQLPLGVTDLTNEDADEFLAILADRGTPYLDLRETLHAEGLDHYNMFYKTDHHWTIESAFWAFQKVTEYMEENWDMAVDPACTDFVNYEKTVYENGSLGSTGKRTGRYFAGMDDFSLIYPSFDTNMTLTIPSENITRSGSFYDTIFAMDRIDPDDYFYSIAYDSYIGGVYPLVIHKNPEAKADKTILLIKDSFASPVEAFLSTCFTEVHCIDMRQYNGHLGDYITETQPDAVICFYNAQSLTNAEQFWFQF